MPVNYTIPRLGGDSPFDKPPPYGAEKPTREHDPATGWAAPANEALTLRERVRHKVDWLLPRLALPMGLLVGAAITAGTTYALVARVQWLVATAAVSSDPNVWMQEARTKAYDVCYHSCTDDCNDVNYAWNACTRTALANVTGVDCDGAKMWNWKDRYPVECLRAVGEFFKSDALEALKKTYRNQLAIIILTVLGGLLGGFFTYHYWRKWTAHRKARAELRGNPFGAPKWPRKFSAPSWRTTRSVRREERGRKVRALSAWFVALFTFNKAATGVPGAKAYSCTGYDDAHNQYFVNANRTLFGVVHGWFSNCYDVQVCSMSCTTSCSGGESNSCSTSCTPVCWTETYSDRAPRQYVEDVLPSVKNCGFSLADQVEGDVNLRVANAGLERFWWLSIRVNGYNVTDVQDTDDAVMCLHDIGKNKQL